MAGRVCAVLALLAVGLAGGIPASAQVSRQDTLRRVTADEYHALRRQWLEARRAGLVAAPPATYGSAVVGSRPAGSEPVRRGEAAGGSGVLAPTAGGSPDCSTWLNGGLSDPRTGGRAGRAEGVVRRRPNGWDGDPCFPGYPGPDGRSGRPDGQWESDGRDRSGCQSPYADPNTCGHYGSGYGSGPGYGYGPAWPGDPFNRAPQAWSGWTGVSEYFWGPWGGVPVFPYGWRSSPGEGYGFSWPGVPAGECVVVTVTAPGGARHSIAVGLQVLGLSDLADLELAIDQRLSEGQAVTLPGIDGRVLRLTPGTPFEDIRVTPCAAR